MTIESEITGLIADGWEAGTNTYYLRWCERVAAFLRAALGADFADDFSSLGDHGLKRDWENARASQIGHLEGLAVKIEAEDVVREPSDQPKSARRDERVSAKTKKVFVVHGHDGQIKETVARYTEKLGLDPIILHEQPNTGRTIIEKFEVFSDVGFAVVLLTPDDVGASKDSPQNLKARARQNVILELGYFLGKLGRSRVCVLYKSGVEIPSDYQGVIYTEVDDAGGWKTKLAQELVEAGFSIDLNAILNT